MLQNRLNTMEDSTVATTSALRSTPSFCSDEPHRVILVMMEEFIS